MTARIERAHPYTIDPSKLACSLPRGWGLIDLPLRASHRKAKVKVEVEDRKGTETD